MSRFSLLFAGVPTFIFTLVILLRLAWRFAPQMHFSFFGRRPVGGSFVTFNMQVKIFRNYVCSLYVSSIRPLKHCSFEMFSRRDFTVCSLYILRTRRWVSILFRVDIVCAKSRLIMIRDFFAWSIPKKTE